MIMNVGFRPISNVPSFKASFRPKGNPLGNLGNIAESTANFATSGSTASVVGGSGVVGTAMGLAGSGIESVGTAFSLNAIDVNSFGIVPYVLEHAKSALNKPAIDWAAQHPSTVGAGLSTTGGALTGEGCSAGRKSSDPF
jgi:hypothetical protein